MTRWIIAFAVAALVAYVGVPGWRTRAFKAGWFERSTQTRRRRSQRRPTHGGVVLAVAVAAGAALAGLDEPVARAILLSCAIAVATGFRVEEGKGRRWVLNAGRVAAAAAIPLVGIRAQVTASDTVDAVFTVIVALVLMAGIRSIERTDATVPLVVAVSSSGLMVAALRVDDPVLPAVAALLGASGALVATTWPPALVRIGVIGPTVLGASLAAVAIELDPAVRGSRSVLVPMLCLAVVAAAAVVRQWDRRLAARHLRPRLVLPLAAAAGCVAAAGIDGEWMELPVAVALALGPVVVLALVAVTVPRRGAAEPRRGLLALAAVGVVLLVGLAAVAALLAYDARRSMLRGQEFATAGLDAARDGELVEAQALFATADAAFADARSALDSPLVRAGELVPGIAPNVHNARTLAAVGGELSSTAVAVAERAGANDLLLVDGVFPVQAARAVSTDLADALATLRTASERLQGARSPFLLEEVERGSDEVAEKIAEAIGNLEVVAEGTRLVPGLLGADGDRRWMVAIITPSEQRGAGGLAGDYAELRAAGGDIDLVRTISASEMNGATDEVRQLAALPAIYRERYAGFRVGRFWQNLSATPDIPTYGRAIADAFPLTTGGGPVDGVVVLDPYGIAALLEVVGPVSVPDWPVPLTAENAASVLLFEHYDQLTEEQIDGFQGDVVEAVVDKLTTGTLPAPSTLAATLTPALAEGHLRLWSPEADPQALFERIGADGTLRPPQDNRDFVQLVTQSASESKIDWYLRRSLAYAPTFDPDTGALTATATVTLTNQAPTSGVASYVIGEEGGPTLVGENDLELSIYSPHRPTGVFDAAGTRLPVNLGREAGFHVVTVPVDLPSGASTTLTFTFEGFLPPSDGRYGLQIGRQPAVAPDQVTVTLAGADGWAPTNPAGGAGPADPATSRTFTGRLGRT